MKTAIATAAAPSWNSPSSEDRAEHQEHAQLHQLDHVLGLRLEALADVGRQMPNAIAAANTAIRPFPSGGSVAMP